MRVEADGYQIDFTDALDAFKFDETDKAKSTYHGATALKAVDIIAEFDTAYVFVEIKEYDTPEDLDEMKGIDEKECKSRHDHFKWLKNYLKYKFRDSLLYRHAEHKVDKPVHYLCLLNFDNALNTRMAKSLNDELPVGKKSPRWAQEISKSCTALNVKKWNELFPRWPVQKTGSI